MLRVNQLAGFGAGISTVFNVEAANFDGSNDHLARGAGLDGASDSKIISASFWIKPTVGSLSYIWADATGDTVINISGAGALQINGANAAGTQILNVTLGSAFSSGNWYHVAFCFDMSDTNKRHIYINGVAQSPTYNTYTNDSIDFTESDWTIGALNPSSPQDWLTADLAEFWLAFGQYVDFSDSTTRQKFRTVGDKPVDLGATGAKPTGTAPTIYQSVRSGEVISAFVTNRGTGGGMTETGALTLSSTSPSD